MRLCFQINKIGLGYDLEVECLWVQYLVPKKGRAKYHMLVIPVLGRLRQEDHRFEISLINLARLLGT